MRRRITALVIILLIAAAIGAGLAARELYRRFQGYAGSVTLEVQPGVGAPALAELLVERGVLARRWPFLLRYAAGRLRQRSLKAGEYQFDRPLRPLEVYWKLVRGEVYLHPVVIPEGTDRFEMARIYHQALGIPPEDFLRATADTGLVRDLDPQALTLEGYLFPDTYRFPRETTAARAVSAMVERFRSIYKSQLQPSLERAHITLHDAATLASLVEKETAGPAERPLVAEVFSRRLEMGWPLACDPTVIYAERLNGRMLEHPLPPITASDLRVSSPYNTYLHKGLPPGPIASPGLASLEAVMEPAATDYLYFVSNNQGGHNFARTLAEHQRNVARYRRGLAELRRVGAIQKDSAESPTKNKNRAALRNTTRSPNRAQR
ncbi:MAG: endolytic transglycosylase MltG [Acidobacteria bacterium]|nr:MAG: endolytic transglycosylase MltG [Acidobacteriota bacterium]